jgi:hypothetical protein
MGFGLAPTTATLEFWVRFPNSLKLLYYFPVTLFTHTNAAHEIVAVLARV